MRRAILGLCALLVLAGCDEVGEESHPAGVGEAPYVVAIWQVMSSGGLAANYTDFQCAGALVSPRHVITTATCIEQSRHGLGTLVSAGSLDRGTLAEITFHKVTEVARHEGFDEVTGVNDLAMLTVEPTFELVADVSVVSVATSDVLPGADCVVAGWRLNFFYTSDQLRAADVKVLPDSACETPKLRQPMRSERDRLLFDGEKLCAGNQGAKECNVGDEGGPLVCDGRLVGLFSSFGWVCINGDDAEPALYQALANHAAWIAEHAAEGGAAGVAGSVGFVVLAMLATRWINVG